MEQHGVVTRAQLVAAGMSTSAIDRRVAAGRLHRLHRGVYAVGHAALRPEGFWLAAVLASGTGAVLSHRSAAAAWDLRPTAAARIDVTIRGSTGRGQRSLATHRCRLAPGDVTRHRGIPITTPERTLLDVAEVVRSAELAGAVDRSVQLGVFDAVALNAVVQRAVGRRGRRALRAALVALDPEPPVTRSALERRAIDLLRASHLPLPAVNARAHGYEVDLLWRSERMVVELDGYAFHRSPASFERDRRRDADLQDAGYRVLRVTWRQLTEDPGGVVARIGRLLRVASEPHAPGAVSSAPR